MIILIFWIILILHLILLVILGIRYKISSAVFSLPFWAVFAPVFGPLSALIGIRNEEKGRDYTELRAFIRGVRKPAYDYRIQDTSNVLSAEEVFLINNKEDRRKAVMDIMKTKVRPYLEILKLAATNEDMETSHYATATIMQIQNEFTQNLNRLYAAAFSEDAAEENVREYLLLLNDYISSGLLGEALVHRQRLTMKSVYEEAARKGWCADLLPMHIKNLIELDDLAEADRLLAEAVADPDAAESLLELRIELLVKMRDEKALKQYIRDVKERRRMLSPELKEKLRFWEDLPEDRIRTVQRRRL